MKYKILIITMLIISIMIMSGCSQQYYQENGVVEYDGDLEKSLYYCSRSCEQFRSVFVKPTPKIQECDVDECICYC